MRIMKRKKISKMINEIMCVFKKCFLICCVCAAVGACLSGCSGDSAELQVQDNLEKQIDGGMDEEEPEAENGTEADRSDEAAESEAGGSSSVDIDLTALSSTMVYSEVYNMMVEPDTYLNKTIKVAGEYVPSYYEETDSYYHFVIVADATACCQQGIEFVWNGEHTYPDDYPADGAQVELMGVYESYEEGGKTFYHLAVESLEVR